MPILPQAMFSAAAAGSSGTLIAPAQKLLLATLKKTIRFFRTLMPSEPLFLTAGLTALLLTKARHASSVAFTPAAIFVVLYVFEQFTSVGEWMRRLPGFRPWVKAGGSLRRGKAHAHHSHPASAKDDAAHEVLHLLARF